jgi:hypothetical protein
MPCDNLGFELECDDDVIGGIADVWMNSLDNITNYEVGGLPTVDDITKINLNGATAGFKFKRVALRTKPATVAQFDEPLVGEFGVSGTQKLELTIDSFIAKAARQFKKYAQTCKCGFVFLIQLNATYLGEPAVLVFGSDPKTQLAATPKIVFGGTPITADPQPASGTAQTTNNAQINSFVFTRVTNASGLSRNYVGDMDSTILDI